VISSFSRRVHIVRKGGQSQADVGQTAKTFAISDDFEAVFVPSSG
jgi:hypothetical protein